jgi:hypothetical protein
MCNNGLSESQTIETIGGAAPQRRPGCSMLRALTLSPCVHLGTGTGGVPPDLVGSCSPQAVWAALDKSISGVVPPTRACVRVPVLVVCDLCLTRVSQAPVVQ